MQTTRESEQKSENRKLATPPRDWEQMEFTRLTETEICALGASSSSAEAGESFLLPSRSGGSGPFEAAFVCFDLEEIITSLHDS